MFVEVGASIYGPWQPFFSSLRRQPVAGTRIPEAVAVCGNGS